MKVDEGKYSIAELLDWHRRRELVANERYQRGAGLWPTSAKSYFIDTIIREFPFPKVYFYERIDMPTKRPKREIVDGQQRLTTIFEFIDNAFTLTSNAREFSGKKFDDLTDDQKQAFLSYTVSVDVIRNAEPPDILQMFRRMNAYTLPLNEAEKRHSEYFGKFKDWVNTVLDRYGAIFIDWNILTSRQIVRMADAEFVADLALAIEEGIVSTSPTKLRRLYQKYDSDFLSKETLDHEISETFDVLITQLSEVQNTYLTRTHVFHSLFCALLHRRFGLPDTAQLLGTQAQGAFFADRDQAISSLKVLGLAYEQKDNGKFRDFVVAASEGGNRAAQRAVRVQWLIRALDGEFA
jgi:hypothetical protein